MKIEQAYIEYISFLKVRRISEETVNNTYIVLRGLMKWLDEINVDSFEGLNKKDVRDYLAGAVDRGVKAISVRTYKAIIKGFFAWGIEHGYLNENPLDGMQRRKVAKPLPSYVPIKEMDALFESFENSSTLAVTQMIMFEFFYATGIRTSELIKLDVSDIDLKDCFVKIRHGKGGKEREVPFPNTLVPTLKRYFQIREKQHFSSDILFPNAHGKRMHRVDAYNYMKEILVATSSKKKGAHTIRHSYASHLLARGAKIKDLTLLLGHTSYKTTVGYTHLEPESLKKIFEKSHPKA